MSAKVGDKFIVEVAEVLHTASGNRIYKMKGFNTLMFDEQGIEKLEPYRRYIKSIDIVAVDDASDLPRYPKHGTSYVNVHTGQVYTCKYKTPAKWKRIDDSKDLHSFIDKGSLPTVSDLPVDCLLGDLWFVTSINKTYVCVESCRCEYTTHQPSLSE